LKRHHLNKIAIGLAAIATISLAIGIFTGQHAPRKDFKEFSIEYDARPQRAPEVVGKIESLVGNTATIAKLNQPNTNGEKKANREDRREFFEALTPEERIAEMEARLNAFTGENIIIEIPAGIEITYRAAPPKNVEGVRELVNEQDFPAENDVTISPLTLAENDYVAIWLDSAISDKNVAEFINLIFTEKDASAQ